MEDAISIAKTADYLLIVGTSLAVYPAAGLMHYVPPSTKVIVVDPKSEELSLPPHVRTIAAKASEGVSSFVSELLAAA